jgi:hypothetical protein
MEGEVWSRVSKVSHRISRAPSAYKGSRGTPGVGDRDKAHVKPTPLRAATRVTLTEASPGRVRRAVARSTGMMLKGRGGVVGVPRALPKARVKVPVMGYPAPALRVVMDWVVRALQAMMAMLRPPVTPMGVTLRAGTSPSTAVKVMTNSTPVPGLVTLALVTLAPLATL